MTVKELYERIGGDYDDILSRFSSDALIDKFIRKFLNEDSFSKLKIAINEKDYHNAFMACHTLKGLCLNMSFDDLCKPVTAFTEELRGDRAPVHYELLDQISEKYANLILEINNYINS